MSIVRLSRTSVRRSLPLLLPALFAAGCGAAASDIPLPDPASADSRALSFTVVESMSDADYWGYVYDGFAMLAEGHAWATHLLGFMQESGSFAPLREIRSGKRRPAGVRFWVSVSPPSTSGTEYQYSEELHALLIPKIPVDQLVAGAILGHELQHAYDRTMWGREDDVVTWTNASFMEMQAYELAIGLVDNHLEGRFGQAVDQVLANREYDLEERLVYRPNKRGRARLDALFGYPSPWEIVLRDPLYAMALCYRASPTPLAKTYATGIYKGFGALALQDSYDYVPYDYLVAPGQTVTSLIEGTVLRLEGAGAACGPLLGIVVRGSGADSARTVRMLGVEGTLSPGAEVRRGTPIGTAQELGDAVEERSPWIHVELYSKGQRMAVQWLVDEVWPATKRTGRPYYSRRNERRIDLIERAIDAELDGEFEKGLALIQEALAVNLYGLTDSYLLHIMARMDASLERYEEAARIQQRLVDQIEAEVAYSKGELPDPLLGPITFRLPPDNGAVWLENMRANLLAYQGGRDTIYIY